VTQTADPNEEDHRVAEDRVPRGVAGGQEGAASQGEGWGGMPDLDGKGHDWVRYHDRYEA
jgi:hypothetical protein